MESPEQTEIDQNLSREQSNQSEESPRYSRQRRKQIEFVPWEDALRPAFLEAWIASGDHAEHVTIIGTTGSGKTTLVIDVIKGKLRLEPKMRCLILMNKKRDTTMRELIDSGQIAHIKKWDDLAYKHRVKRLIVLWPDYPDNTEEVAKIAGPVFRDALNGIMREGDWMVYIDEANYMIEQLHLRAVFDEYWGSSRSNGIPVIAGGQRPVYTGKGMTSQHSWFFSFKIKDLTDRKSVGIAVGDRVYIPQAVGELSKHDFLLAHTDGEEVYISNVET
jgi:hypothetical protein